MAYVHAGGASVTVSTLQCQAGQVSSQGGPITLDSFQGSARLQSYGGSIEVGASDWLWVGGKSCAQGLQLLVPLVDSQYTCLARSLSGTAP